jgi:glycosyltransferase involved in cell wall biosynthesis
MTGYLHGSRSSVEVSAPMKVSVLVTAFNHEKYIEQALESVLVQKVGFNYEIIVGEDCSTDSTREIVVRLHEKFPERIQLFLPEQNLGAYGNRIFGEILQLAKGCYVALLDGDDYWTDCYKLQKQADFLDAHPECAICFHNAIAFYENGNREPWNWTPASQKEISSIEDLWMDNAIAFSATMFRRGLFGHLPSWYFSMFCADWALHILNAEHGRIGYLSEVMAAYRYHSGGMYSRLSEFEKLEETLKFYKAMNINTNFRYKRIIKTALIKRFYESAEEFEKRGDRDKARTWFRRCLAASPRVVLSQRRLLGMWLRLYVRS